MNDLRILMNEESVIEGEKVSYELVRICFCGKICYVVGVSYLGEKRICALDVENERIATDMFVTLITYNTTPLILFDTVYELLH